MAARAIANSLLVKSSWYGNDPNWGRIMDALGYSGAALSEQTVQMWYENDSGMDSLEVFCLAKFCSKQDPERAFIPLKSRYECPSR